MPQAIEVRTEITPLTVDYHIYRGTPQYRVIPALMVAKTKKAAIIRTWDELTNKIEERRVMTKSLTVRVRHYPPLDDMNEGQYE